MVRTFWKDVWRRWPAIFESFVKKWKFWAGIAGAVALPVTAQVTDRLAQWNESWWVVVVPLGLSAVYALIRAIEAQYEELHRDHVALGDRLSSEIALRKQAERAAGGNAGEPDVHVKALSEFALDGRRLSAQIKKQGWDETVKQASKAWEKNVENYLNQHLRHLLPVFLKDHPPPHGYIPGDKRRAIALAEINAKVENLLAVVERLEGRVKA